MKKKKVEDLGNEELIKIGRLKWICGGGCSLSILDWDRGGFQRQPVTIWGVVFCRKDPVKQRSHP